MQGPQTTAVCHKSYIDCVSKIRAIVFFCSAFVKYKLISIKIGRHVLEKTLNKTI